MLGVTLSETRYGRVTHSSASDGCCEREGSRAIPKHSNLQTISVNLPRQLVKQVQSLGFHHDLSVSSIVEHSLSAFLSGASEEQCAERLRDLGATLRRVAE
jgi:hypothetical protein